jgi:hypothetical protein
MDGQLHALDVPSNQVVKISACYTDQGSNITKCDTHDVIIHGEIKIQALAMQIIGSVSMYEGDTEIYVIQVTYSDNTIVNEKTNDWAITFPAVIPSFISASVVDGKYSLTANSMGGSSTANLTIRARWSDLQGNAFSDDHVVTIIKNLAVLRPCWGFGPFGGLNDAFVVTYCTNMFPELSGFTLSTAEGSKEYLYFCSPVSLGKVQFYFSDETSTLLEGGMDGAKWPDNGIGTDNTPVVLTRSDGITPSQWYLYRSDFRDIGSYTIKVVYENA